MKQALQTIAEFLDGFQCQWALGASWVLHHHGILNCPKDIDIVVNSSDPRGLEVYLKEKILFKNKAPSPLFSTDVAVEAQLGDVSVDVLINFGVWHQEKDIRYNLLLDRPFSILEGMDTPIPVCSLEGWHLFYTLMGDPKGRVPMIDTYFQSHGLCIQRFNDFYALTGSSEFD